MLTLSCCWWVSTAAVPLLVWWFASKFLLSEKRKNSSSSRGNTSDPSTMTNNNHGINNNGNMIVNQTIFNNTMAHSNLLSSSTTTTTHSSSLSSWNEKSFLKKLVNVFSLFEKAISDDDLSKRISLSSANTLTSMESGQDHVKILHFKKCSLNIVMDTLQSNSMKQLIMDFYAKQQQESDETVVTTVHNGSSSNGETSTTRTDTKNTHPIPPFEGLEMSHLFNLDLYSSIDDSIRLELVSMILREDLSLVKGYLSAHVHMIEITHCKLTRIPIELLAQFPNLTSLNLSHNLIECIPEEFFVLASEKCPLKILNLSENKLRSIPNYFSTLFIKHKLLTLNVQENYIDLNTSIPTELKYITGRDKTHLSPNDDFTSPVNNFVKKKFSKG
ncbi:hypothetical protein FDP41_004958 [Naegleria fowleri]|uniref:Leucine-rich repeat-containing protein n=1 Tax=Naegleria fowleri TaxID=5763 RepID=A0A6A5BEN1_NAEFO|nr:uncharacterized protein FDP41_004958 [Naegleria fowleri]KAF0976283.1 hypothetical protein FDP41_004958 [Naegleria fowleri]